MHMSVRALLVASATSASYDKSTLNGEHLEWSTLTVPHPPLRYQRVVCNRQKTASCVKKFND